MQAKRDAETAAELEKESLERKEGRSNRRDSDHSRRSRSPVKDRDRKSRCPAAHRCHSVAAGMASTPREVLAGKRGPCGGCWVLGI